MFISFFFSYFFSLCSSSLKLNKGGKRVNFENLKKIFNSKTNKQTNKRQNRLSSFSLNSLIGEEIYFNLAKNNLNFRKQQHI
jgi:hypothetical protein